MKYLLILFTCLITHACADHSAQQERCEKLQSVADRAAGSCSVGHSCFSLDCKPTLQIASGSEFHIFIEPCKHPAAILINATIAGQKFSHEFTHSETVAVPSLPLLNLKIAVILNNSDSQNLVFSVVLVTPFRNLPIVPETSFPLNNITCVDGHLLTPAATPTPSTGPGSYSCQATCVAIHKMTSKTNSLCQSTGNCLTINCNSPHSVQSLSSSYRIEPCTSPPTIRATFDDHDNNKHFSRNITHNTTFSPPFYIIGNPQIQITLVDVNNYTILFGVNLIVLTQTISILPDQTIPIDKSGCPGYTGPDMNPYCTTQSTEPVNTTPVSHSSDMPSRPTATSMHSHPITTNGTSTSNAVPPSLNNTAAVGSDAGKLAGIIMGVILVNVVIVSVSVLVTVGVVWYVFKRKNRGVYTYSHFQALEEDD